MLKKQSIKSENEFPLQATYFPVGERRIASSATTPFSVLPVLLSLGSQVALPHKSVTFLAKVFK
ncbi:MULTISPECIES: hypothetical protein [Lysinibacillus]|uniref:hypothetical protein n=1 Tax=Lysinibacillus TaxID=400634 RepID=UPI0009BCC350|nr:MULTISPECIES: hypothetical protein [Lysinibacillus]MCT1539817.1 hypothetical protein [Lysinibacillus capsici]MCT1570887.1 hypothetical protein [Lysinibacillus capsici]MCT1648290.1 hypothetical protein [Lysinibacillus capsici]MCT1726832.1 hypothetical protein [Lysinibacillus capsici]MCT1783783.1 hypothetical protein [Lysinibacillus capsici]